MNLGNTSFIVSDEREFARLFLNLSLSEKLPVLAVGLDDEEDLDMERVWAEFYAERAETENSFLEAALEHNRKLNRNRSRRRNLKKEKRVGFKGFPYHQFCFDTYRLSKKLAKMAEEDFEGQMKELDDNFDEFQDIDDIDMVVLEPDDEVIECDFDNDYQAGYREGYQAGYQAAYEQFLTDVQEMVEAKKKF